MNWNGKKVIITGGSTGIGRQLVHDLTAKGALVAFCGLTSNTVQKVISETHASGWTINLTKEEELIRFFQEALNALKGIDILINNAGYVIAENFLDLKRTDFEHMFAINAIAPARLAQLALPIFKNQGFGDIVNIGATGGSYAFAKGTAYSASKSALGIISKNLQLEHRKDNIRTFHIDPSWVTDTHNFNYGSAILRDENKLVPEDIATSIIQVLEMDRRGFIPQMSIWGTQP